MKYKINILLFFLLGISNMAYCCAMATQERIIPLGTSENCLVGIEIISNRYGLGEYGERAVWDLKFTLKGFNLDYSDFTIRHLDFKKECDQDSIELLLENRILKAIEICKALNDFEFLVPKEISFCDFQKKCSSIQLKKSNNQLRVEIDGDKDFEVKFLDSKYEGEIAKPYKI